MCMWHPCVCSLSFGSSDEHEQQFSLNTMKKRRPGAPAARVRPAGSGRGRPAERVAPSARRKGARVRQRPAAANAGAGKRPAAATGPDQAQAAARERLRQADRNKAVGPAPQVDERHKVDLLKRPAGRSSSPAAPRGASGARGSPSMEAPPITNAVEQKDTLPRPSGLGSWMAQPLTRRCHA